jgi:hypothetical protein
MKFNQLGYQVIIWENEHLPTHYIELLVDGEPISDLLKSSYKSIPFTGFSYKN